MGDAVAIQRACVYNVKRLECPQAIGDTYDLQQYIRSDWTYPGDSAIQNNRTKYGGSFGKI